MQSPEYRERLVATLRARGALHAADVARAFSTVPRETFVPGLSLDAVYRDDAIVTKIEDGIGVSSSSQPAIMALMLEQLDPFPGARVLEIGAGTGYNAALMRELVGESGQVVTIDIDEEVAGWASERLLAAGYPDVQVVCADGADGWEPLAPYDRIQLTVGADDIAPAWHEQLVDGGRLVLPLWVQTSQVSIAFERRGASFLSRSVQHCGFIFLRGRMASITRMVPVAHGVMAMLQDEAAVSLVRALLREYATPAPWPGRAWDGFSFVAGLWGLPIFTFWAANDAGAPVRGGGFALHVPASNSLAMVASTTDSPAPQLLAFGSAVAADRLSAAFERWQSLGSPDVDQLDIAAYPLEAAPVPSSSDIVIATRSWELHVARSGGALR